MNPQFTYQDLVNFSKWEMVTDGFDLDCAEEDCMPLNEHIIPIIAELRSMGYTVDHYERGGLCNYSAFFCYPSLEPYGEFVGVTVYHSLLAPYAVWGRTAALRDRISPGHGFVGLDNVLSPNDASSEFERIVVGLVESTPYTFLEYEVLSTPLPDDIRPFEYCLGSDGDVLCMDECDRLFHVMFSNTD
jgi:uncharacterized protein (DUF779 family)